MGHKLLIPQISRKSTHNFFRYLAKSKRTDKQTNTGENICGAGKDIQQSQFVAFLHVLTILKVTENTPRGLLFPTYRPTILHQTTHYACGSNDAHKRALSFTQTSSVIVQPCIFTQPGLGTCFYNYCTGYFA